MATQQKGETNVFLDGIEELDSLLSVSSMIIKRSLC